MNDAPRDVMIGKTTAFAVKLQRSSLRNEYLVLATRGNHRFGWPTNDEGILIPLNRMPTEIEIECFAKEIEMRSAREEFGERGEQEGP